MQFKVGFKSLDARRSSDKIRQVSINNNSTLTKVEKEEDRLRIEFVFTTNYDPNIGSIRIEGDLFMGGEKEDLDKIYDKWQTSGNNDLPVDVAEKIHNSILTNCLVEASVLARDINLPVPMPVPQVSMNEQPKQDESDTSYIR